MLHVRKNIALCNIVIDREPIGPSTLALVDYLRSGGKVPPIHVQLMQDGRYKILDGRHRVLAFKLLGRQEIEARFCERHYPIDFEGTLAENELRAAKPWLFESGPDEN